jgi:hypothetical protein
MIEALAALVGCVLAFFFVLVVVTVFGPPLLIVCGIVWCADKINSIEGEK